MQIPPPCGLVTLLTDFGLADPYVGILKGVVKRQHARAEVLDFCHGVPAQDVQVGALFLRAAIDRFPLGTVHVAVVDPGVGTARRLLAVAAAGCYWLGPDNGLLSAVLPQQADDHEREVRCIDLVAVGISPVSATFHGRDILAPLAGQLAAGKLGYRALGPRCTDPVRLPVLEGHSVLHVDGYGNLITTVRAGVRQVTIRGRTLTVRTTYADAAPGELLALVNSYDLVEIAVRDGSAARVLGAGRGESVVANG